MQEANERAAAIEREFTRPGAGMVVAPDRHANQVARREEHLNEAQSHRQNVERLEGQIREIEHAASDDV